VNMAGVPRYNVLLEKILVAEKKHPAYLRSPSIINKVGTMSLTSSDPCEVTLQTFL